MCFSVCVGRVAMWKSVQMHLMVTAYRRKHQTVLECFFTLDILWKHKYIQWNLHSAFNSSSFEEQPAATVQPPGTRSRSSSVLGQGHWLEINPVHAFDCGGKAEHPDESHTDTRKHANTTQKSPPHPGFEPRTFVPWRGRANRRTTVSNIVTSNAIATVQ